jgi:hypothetical protein
MGMRWRSPLGGLILVVGLAVYTVVATTVGSNLPDNILLLSVYYLVAGVVWIWPAMWVLAWAKKDDAASGD